MIINGIGMIYKTNKIKKKFHKVKYQKINKSIKQDQLKKNNKKF